MTEWLHSLTFKGFPPDAKSRLIGKHPDVGKDWKQEEKGMAENEMVGWHHHLNGYEFKQTLGVGEGQGSLVHCSPWGHKEPDTTEWLDNSNSIELPGGAGSQEPACQWRKCWRPRFSLWVQKIHWRRAWLPIPAFWPGESHGQWSLEGYSLQGCRVGHDWST